MQEDFEVATLANGCFWCADAVFRRLNGISNVVSGYAGEEEKAPNYDEVASGKTNFTEAVQIKFDPKVISFEKILEVFWATHDPTSKDKQGADTGAQYRSVIYYHSPKQKEIAEKSLKIAEKDLDKRIVTDIIPFKNFHNAEEEHQNFYDRNKNSVMYCPIVIAPKIQKLLDKFNADVKDEYKN